jgi:ABC-type tungstate transport system permease subunit
MAIRNFFSDIEKASHSSSIVCWVHKHKGEKFFMAEGHGWGMQKVCPQWVLAWTSANLVQLLCSSNMTARNSAPTHSHGHIEKASHSSSIVCWVHKHKGEKFFMAEGCLKTK